MKEKDIELFEKTDVQLSGLYEEISKLSQKKPNDPINLFKLKIINTVLQGANSVLGKRYSPFQDTVQLNEDDIPSNSDVNMILSQYLQCMDKLRIDNTRENYEGVWHWVIDGKTSDTRAIPPRRKMES